MKKRSKNAGFSLLELVIVIAIIGILAAVATPSLMNWLPNKRLKAASRDIVFAMAQAKAEAIRRGDRVALRFPDPKNFSPGDQLYFMFVDNGKKPRDANGIAEAVGNGGGENNIYDAGEEVLLSSGPLPGRVVPEQNTFAQNAVVFNNRGLPVNESGGLGAGSIRLCVAGKNNKPGSPCRLVKVSAAGRVTVEFD